MFNLFKVVFVLVIILKVVDIGFEIAHFFRRCSRRNGKKTRSIAGVIFGNVFFHPSNHNDYIQSEQNRLFTEESIRAHNESVRMHHEAVDMHNNFVNNDFMNNSFMNM